MKKRTDLVCLDSDVLIWGLKKEASQGQEHMIPKTVAFIDYLYKAKKRIIIPAPILTELTWVLDEEQRANVIQKITKRFIVAPFDERAALICSKMLAQYQSMPQYEEIKLQLGKRRLKYDTMIAAIAIANGCERLYTNNTEDYALASSFIRVEEIPYIPEQKEINFDNEAGQ